MDGTQTFEFTHKSFGEYLTAKKIVRQLKDIQEQLLENENDILNRKGWNIEECLLEWVKIFGQKTLDYDIIRFIQNEFAIINANKPDELPALQELIVKLLNHVLLYGMPLEKLYPRLKTFKEENEQAINAERAVLIMHSLIAEITWKVSDIEWNQDTAFGNLLNRLVEQRVNASSFMLQFLNHLNLSDLKLDIKDLYNSNLAFSNLQQTNLWLANLRGAYLIGANLRRADLERADLIGANLRNANLRNANLEGAKLRGADLERADLGGADLERANLERANLREADLREADLREADLREANLEGAKLRGANLYRDRKSVV